MWRLLALSLVIAVLTTAFLIATMALMKFPAGYVFDPVTLSARWMLGNYMGALTVTPCVLAIYQWAKGKTFRAALDSLVDDRRTVESIFMAVPVVSILVWVGISIPSSRSLAQVALFLPVIWLAMRHGWVGAALGGTAVSFAVMLLMPKDYDPQTMQAEAIISLTVSTMLLLGAHVTTLNERAKRECTSFAQAIALAQRNAIASEIRLRTASVAIDHIGESVQASHTGLMNRIRLLAPAGVDRSHQIRASLVHDQIFKLSNVLYPVAWRERGLQTSLRESVVARSIMECGAHFTADFRGPLSRLTPPMHLAVYRIITEIIADACTGQPFTDANVRVRCGVQWPRSWVAVAVTLRTDEDRVNDIDWPELKTRIARDFGSGAWELIEDRAATFEGRASRRLSHGRRRINVLMFEPQNSAASVEPLSS